MTLQRRREPDAGPHATAAESAAGIARLEGYLLAQRARSDAAEAGIAFARRFPWLGPDERAAVARAFAEEHLSLRRRMLQATVARVDELRREYRGRYASLRRRLVAAVLGLAAATSAVLAWVARGPG